jgi:adenylate kinase family enzyme
MKRVLVIGSGGAGKSTLAVRLGEITGIEVIHLDKLYWRAGWVEPSKEEWRETVEGLLNKETWILDGNFGGTMDLRFDACDTVILLDLPSIICIYRVLKRRLKFRNTNRPEMTKGCNEQLDIKFLNWIWNFPNRNRPAILEKLDCFRNEKSILQLRSQREVDDFLANLIFEKALDH